MASDPAMRRKGSPPAVEADGSGRPPLVPPATLVSTPQEWKAGGGVADFPEPPAVPPLRGRQLQAVEAQTSTSGAAASARARLSEARPPRRP